MRAYSRPYDESKQDEKTCVDEAYDAVAAVLKKNGFKVHSGDPAEELDRHYVL